MGEIWFGGKIQMMNPGCIALLWHFQSVKIENVKIKSVKLFLIFTFEFYTLQNVRLKQHSPGTGLKTVARSIYKKALNAVQCTDKNQKLVIQKKNSKYMEIIGFYLAKIIRKICTIFSWFTVKCCIFRSIEVI